MKLLIPDARDLAVVLGWLLVSLGAGMLSLAAGLIVAGAVLLLIVFRPNGGGGRGVA